MSRLAVIDLLFQWPPDGGARVDLVHILGQLTKYHQVVLFYPVWDWQICRGHVSDQHFPFQLKPIRISGYQYQRWSLSKLLFKEVRAYEPDLLLVADGWAMKSVILRECADIPYFVRFYAYELTCLREYGIAYRRGAVCRINTLSGSYGDLVKCQMCGLGHALRNRSQLYIHDLISSGALFPWYGRENRELLARAQGLFVSNAFMAARLEDINPTVHIISGGVDSVAFCPAQDYEDTPEGPVFFAAGRMDDPLKGLAIIRQAGSVLSAQGCRFIIAYTGTRCYSEPFMRKLGWIEHGTMVQHYRKARAVVIPAQWAEPFGLTVLESMSCGVPVIASRIGSLSDLIEDGVDGFLVEPGDVRAWSEAMRWIIDHPELSREMGKRGREKVRATYQWSQSAEIMMRAMGLV
ncbi:glycosyltransferase family 4 protein [bacterium]|nr:glycosyltransferase family 4 protein [bacterium]